MAFEELEGKEFKDQLYDQVLEETTGELNRLEDELTFPSDVDSQGNYKKGAFDEFSSIENNNNSNEDNKEFHKKNA